MLIAAFVPAPRGARADGAFPVPVAADPSPLRDGAPVPDGSFVRVTVDGGVSPFTRVSWDVTVRGSTVVVSLVKETLCQAGQRERVRLLEGDGGRALVAALREAGAWSCAAPRGATTGRSADSPPPSDQPRYEIWSAWGPSMARYHLAQDALADAPCALGIVTAVTGEVRHRLDPLPMRGLYVPPERLGWLTMTASEAATAVFDGWDAVALPVDGLEMVEGEHPVVVTGESGRLRRFTVKIAPGMGQRVHVVLEEGGGGTPAAPSR